MMWAAAAPYPYYSEYHSSKRKESTGKNGSSQSVVRPLTSSSAAAPGSATGLGTDMPADLLEPAIDGPPSPDRLRALNKQMKQAADFDKHRSHHPSASASSTHNSSDRPWDQVLDNITLSRRSSGRSTSSSMPSRERPDSVQLFGKTIFGRKGARLKRDSSANSSSASSLYSGETPLENTQPSAKDHLKPGIFTRRRAAKSDPYRDASPMPARLKKNSISGPYNFQHVTHTPREHGPALERASRMGSVTELPILSPNDSRFPDLPPENNFANGSSYGSGVAINVEPHAHINVDRPHAYTAVMMPRSGPRRLVKSSKSQDHMRVPPPRPPRPPKSAILETEELSFVTSPPIPPPRLSSRHSIRYGAFDPLATTTLARPQTSGGFRQPEPFYFATGSSPPPTAHGNNPSADFGMASDSYHHAMTAHHAMTTPDDEAWPLTPTTTATTTTTQDGPLPDVPEEDEAPRVSHKSRGSVRSVLSTSSSVRRSRSVPQLRRSTQQTDLPEASHRPTSAGSDTLGRFDLFAAQRALRSPTHEYDEMDSPGRSSWEDDIDFCYEHELEAVCDYEWTRRSSETCRDEADATPYLTLSESRSSPAQTEAAEPTSRLLLTPENEDIPALSPASQVSLNDPEAITPTTTALPAPPSFSNRRPGAAGLALRKTRPVSTASSFKESHGFTLSPSLLIPADYQQQMTLATSGAGYDGSGPVIVDDYHLTATPHSSTLDRVSTSTLGTDSSRSATSSAGRHESTSTAFTRFTGDSEEGSWSPKSEAAHPRNECSFVETLIPGPPPEVDAGLAVPEFSPGIPGVGRPRAKTTSLATPQPRSPFSLFPRSPSMRRL